MDVSLAGWGGQPKGLPIRGFQFSDSFDLFGQNSKIGAIMNVRSSLILGLILISAIPLTAHDNKNKKEVEKGILEKMEAVPCGAKQRGLAGLGALWGSAGITHINSNEKLCPQYLLRTDEMDYEIRPIDLKHATLLPIGQEGAFKIEKNEMILSMTDQKPRSYEVVSMNPANPDTVGGKSSSPSQDNR
jgi:hypothetical protein